MNEPKKRLHFSFGRRLPMVFQTEVAECGLACLAMIAGYHGYYTDLLTLRRYFSVSLRGSTLQDLMDLAGRLRLTARAVKLELNDLKYLRTPCILHWDMDHFVVLKKVRGGTVIIHDPATGVAKYTLSEVSGHFTGVAMELTPMADFKKRKNTSSLSLRDLWRSMTGIGRSLTNIIMLSLAMELFAIVSPLFMQFITDNVIVTQDFPLLYTLAIGFGMLTGIQAVTEYVRAWIIMYLGNILNLQLSAGLAHHLFGLPLEFFEKRHMGDIVSRFGSLSAIQQKISSDFVEGIVDGIMVIATMTVMFVYNYILTFVVLAALLLYIIIRTAFYSTFKRQNQENLVASARENSIFMESVRAILPLKTFGKETQRENVWQNAYVDRLNSMIRMGKLGLLYRLLNHLVFGVENIVVIMLGASAVMHSTFSIGMLLAYLSYRQQFVGKAQGMVDKIVEYRMVSLHLERVADIALAEPEVMQGSAGSTVDLQGSVQTEGLAFRYSDNDPYLFQNLNLAIGAGETVAIVGRSGCGKTTLVKILLRLLMPSTGRVLVDGTDVRKIDVHAYRSQVAAVMQDDILLSGSIAENICFFDSKPDQEHMYTCAMIAAIHEEISDMPMAYQSLVGDMGTGLSGGQKQRILLARALYSRPRILLLDEATSHLDAEAERIIHENIAHLGITRIIVAHRRESIAIADRVIELGGGVEK